MNALLRASWALFALAARTDRGRLARASALVILGYLATPLIALGLMAFTNAAIARDAGAATWFAVGVAVLLVVELMAVHFAHLAYFEVGELVEVRLNAQLGDLLHGAHGLHHFDDPRVTDAVALMREGFAQTRDGVEALLQFCGLALQTAVTTILLCWLDPWLILLPIAALPPVLIGDRAQRVLDAAKEATSESTRLAAHLLAVSTSMASAKEVRIFHAEEELIERQAGHWSLVSAALRTAQFKSAALRASGQLLFALAYGGAIIVVISQAAAHEANLGQVVLVITLAVQVSLQVSSALGLLSRLQSCAVTQGRLAKLRERLGEEDTRRSSAVEVVEIPRRLERGIRLENVSFAYPGTDRLVLRELSLDIPPGATTAFVGENGAGKSTLVKLLCGLYEPTAGRIMIDGVDLRDIDPDLWRARLATLFQDFAMFELRLRENVGVGELDRLRDDDALTAALRRAKAEPILERVPGGLDGLLGHGYGDGVELSGGQWQSLGLSRCHLRDDPLLLVLDEPASALDAAAEHALFAQYAESARQAGRDSGAITIFVSHRFSTVRMADVIVVLDQGGLVEVGDHARLMESGGLYAELFGLQARAYRH
ncbi:ABC transporter ATP-binding protein [Streptosporangium sp. NPDC000396]|uniref:ABC transporter ATP-binding protein n=1 Tax=Streptosporangium sp. NPDC000396 TaxID=3366185 RepID=UPI003674115A